MTTAQHSAGLGDAVDHYHDLLTDDLAGESQRWLDDQLHHRGLFFGDRPLCTVLRPRFLGVEQYRLLRRSVGAVLRAFSAAAEAAIDRQDVLAQFRLEPWERELALTDLGLAESCPLSRVDAFFDEDGLSVTEYNAENPAGAAYNDALAEVFLTLPAMRPFVRAWSAVPLVARAHTVNVLLECYHAWSGQRALPRIAILDWSDVPTQSEFRLFQQHFETLGIDCVIADPRDTELRAGRLHASGAPIDLIYKRVLLHELVARMGTDNPVLQAVRSRAVCLVNPPACKILHKKASLAVLSDERNAGLFDAAMRQTIEALIPWTRVVEERRTTVDGTSIDLLPWMSANRDRLVLKPNDDYGGKGIVLGWEVSADRWNAAIQAALVSPYIVQRRITLENEPYPSLVDGRVVVADRMVDTAPYVAHGSFVDGCLTRLSTAALLNVTAGGGSQVPTFVVEPRS